MRRSRGRGGAGQTRGAVNDGRSHGRTLYESGDVTALTSEGIVDGNSFYNNHQTSGTVVLGGRRPYGHRGYGRGTVPGIFYNENPQGHHTGGYTDSYRQGTQWCSQLDPTETQNNEETAEASATTRLKKLLHRDENEILFKLQTPSFGFEQRLQQGSTSQMMTELLIEVIAMACSSVHQTQLTDLLNKVQNSNFLKICLLQYLNNFVQEDAMVSPKICKYLISIMRTLAKLFPSKSLTVITALSAPLKSILTIDTSDYDEANDDFRKLLEETTDIRKQLQSNVLQRDQERHIDWTVDESEDYRRMSVVPTSEDVRGQGDQYLRENKIYKPYKDSRDYLDVQFRLLKEDLVRPLREGLAELLRNREEGNNRRTKTNMKVYRRVLITAVRCSQHGLIYKIQFDVSRLKHVRWEAGKRLMFGSLVCLSADEFKTMLIATVAERDARDLRCGITYLYFDGDSNGQKDIKLDTTYEMIESPAYYEPYKNVLEALQKFTDEEKLPFEGYLLNKSGEKNVPPPKYLTEDTTYDFSSLLKKPKATRLRYLSSRERLGLAHLRDRLEEIVNVLDLSSWPTADELGLDESQNKALQTAVTKEFAVIQGPPGTGKTFIGVKIVQLLLENNNERRNKLDGPIMLVCFTNHALDQFLEEIIRLYPTDVQNELFVRIGGSSKSESEELKKCFLKTIKQNRPRAYKGATIKPRENMARLENEIMKLSASAEFATRELINPDALRPYMRHFQFKNVRHLFDWLCDRKAEPGSPNLLDNDADVDGSENQNDLENEPDSIAEYEDLELMQTEEREQNDNNLKSVEEKFRAVAKLVLEENEFVKLTGKEDKRLTELYQTAHRIHLRFNKAFQESDDIISERNQWQLSLADRWRMYNYWTKRFTAAKKEEMEALLKDHATEKRKLDEVQNENDYIIFKNAKIIAMTTTGAARGIDLLKRVAPKVVIVEEAAEVLEAHVVASLSDKCEHLILIGDHQQLKPKPADYSLAKRYRLDISLFEKVVLNKLHCDRLTIQHRMRPEIAELLVPHIYKSLENHKSVFKYENVANIFGNLFFLNHSEYENSTDEDRSHSNNHEATFLSELCRYFLHVGYDPTQITVLTTYTGQFFLLRKSMPKPEFDGVRVTPVDNFQGEENDIILLSLVRSNEERKIGFLSISNRVCVALSRAKKGLYIIGNGELLRDESPLWRDILDTLKKQNRLVDSLPLGCHKHSEDTVFVKVAADFKNVPRGGCKYPCDFRLSCGHVCIKRCHELDPDHKLYKCRKPCPKLCANDAHPCRNLCFENCGDCMELVERTLTRCGHQATMSCYLKEETFQCVQPCKRKCASGHPCQRPCFEICKCPILVTRTLTQCQHEATLRCYLPEIEFRCREPCKKRCNFDHPCKRPCFQKCGQCDVLVTRTLSSCKHEAEMPCFFQERRFKCKERCSKSCSSNHPCEKLCYESCGICVVPVTKILSVCKHEAIIPCYMEESQYLKSNQCAVEVELILPLCGHVIKLPCHLSVRPYNCLESCEKSCSNGHPCERKCHEPCGVCRVTVEKVLPRCEHRAMMPCYQRVDSYKCQVKCDRVCPDGHLCPQSCHAKCDDCTVPVEKVLPSCEHKVKMPCHKDPGKHRCVLPCERKCPEGHRCPKNCGDDCGNCILKVDKVLPQCNHVNRVKCYQSPNAVICKLPCEKLLLCGHKCQDICGAVKCTSKCKAKLEKELPCKHMAKMKCYKDPSTYLYHQKARKMLQYGHTASVECHEDLARYSCLQPVQKKLLCDHVATMACSLDPATYQCRERIKVVVCQNEHTKEVNCCFKNTKFPPCVEMVKLTCTTGLPNHVFSVPCRAQETENRLGCPKVCDVKLDCGHTCTNTCRTCVQQGNHRKCMLKCEKQFSLCLHKLQQYCSEQCKPCQDKSWYICSHRKSQNICTEKHEFCLKPCDWSCPHYSCTSVCSKPCDRPPCNQPCRKPLKCGHVCSGLCGEPCISLCRRCNKYKFYEIVWSPFNKDDSRFLELQPCGHIVDVFAMDAWFQDILTSLPCTLDHSRFLLCPVCIVKVSFCPRYNQYIKRHEAQLNSAKQQINDSKRLKGFMTEYVDAWLKFHDLNPETRKELFLRHLPQRLRLGTLCVLQEIETLSQQTTKSDFHERFILSLGNAIERVKTDDFYNEDIRTTSARETILMYKFYMEVQIHRLASFIRGPKLRVLDKCKEHLQAFKNIELVEDNFQRFWAIIDKLNRKLSQQLTKLDRKDDIEDYIQHLNRFYDLELDAAFTSRWMCCTYGHVYASKDLVDGTQIDELCPFCHPPHRILLYFLKPDHSEDRAIYKQIDTTGYYKRNRPNESASGFKNEMRKETGRTDPEEERVIKESGAATRRMTAELEVIKSVPEWKSTAEGVRGRGGPRGNRGWLRGNRGGARGNRGRGAHAPGSQVDRNSEYFPDRDQQLVNTHREPQALVPSSSREAQRAFDRPSRASIYSSRGRGRGYWTMKDSSGIEERVQTSTLGESPTAEKSVPIATAHGDNFREGKRGFKPRGNSRYVQMPNDRSVIQSPELSESRDTQHFWRDTVRAQLEHIQAASSPAFLENQTNNLPNVASGQDGEANRSPRKPPATPGNGAEQNSRAKHRRGSRSRGSFRR